MRITAVFSRCNAHGRRRAGAATLVLLAIAACSPRDGDVRRFQLTGIVVGRETSPLRVVVSHDPVNGLMPAMAMSFDVSGAAPAMREGDRIAATLVVTNSRSWLEDVRITAASSGSAEGASQAQRAEPGALVPGFQLVNQDGQTITTKDFTGRVLVLTFIYTRCPLPDYCPLMISHLESVRRRANEAGIGDRVALLGVTLDPGFDTPAVLRTYGESVLKGGNRFDQWTLAGGTAAQIAAVASFFGVGYKADEGLVTHTLTTAVVSHDGRVMRTFRSNSWRLDELFDVVRRGGERARTE